MFTEIIDSIIALIRDNLVIAVAAGLAALFIAYKFFKFFFKVIIVLGILGLVLYLILSMASTGTSRKQMLHQKSLPENITSLHLRMQAEKYSGNLIQSDCFAELFPAFF